MDDWLFIKIKKIYEKHDILRYKFFVDTIDEDDYSIMEFPKRIRIKYLKKYIHLYKRLTNRGLLKIEKHIATNTVEDYENNRRSVIALKYILDYHKKENEYISQTIIINEKLYDYYYEVTQAIKCFGFKNENHTNK